MMILWGSLTFYYTDVFKKCLQMVLALVELHFYKDFDYLFMLRFYSPVGHCEHGQFTNQTFNGQA